MRKQAKHQCSVDNVMVVRGADGDAWENWTKEVQWRHVDNGNNAVVAEGVGKNCVCTVGRTKKKPRRLKARG